MGIMKKAIEWKEKHEKEIRIAAGVIVAGGLAYLGVKHFKNSNVTKSVNSIGELAKEWGALGDMVTGAVDWVEDQDDVFEAGIQGVQLSDLGNFGAELMEKLPDICESPKDDVWLLVSIGKVK